MHFYPEFEDLRTTLYRMANTHSHTRKKKHTQTDNIFHPGHSVLTGVLLKEFLDSELGKGTGKQRSFTVILERSGGRKKNAVRLFPEGKV